MNQPATNPLPADTQVNWLELARFAAVGQGHDDLGRGVQRLATLAAAVHRTTVTPTPSMVRTEKDLHEVHGRTSQAAPQIWGTSTDAGISTLAPGALLPGAEDER